MMPDGVFTIYRCSGMDAMDQYPTSPVLASGCRYLKSFFLLQAVAACSD